MKFYKIVGLLMIGVIAQDDEDLCKDVKDCVTVDVKEKQGVSYKDDERSISIFKSYKKDDEQPEDATTCQKSVEKETITYYLSKDCKGNAIKGAELQIAKETSNWNYEDNICFLNGKQPVKAYPSLDFCYKTRKACCNYLEDADVGGVYSSFVPGPCIGDFKELQIFSCLGCKEQTNSFVLKAEASEQYVTTINELQKVQTVATGIHRTLQTDIERGHAPNGYIKICAHWLQRFWTNDNVPYGKMKKENQILQTKINKPTEIFDACGVYDINGEGAIPYPSTNDNFADAMTFLEYYGLKMMPGFGFIIIDNMQETDKKFNVKTSTYDSLLKKLQKIVGLDQFNETTTVDDPQMEALLTCFNSGKTLAINLAALVFTASFYTVF